MSDGNIGASINAYNTSLDISFGEVYEVDKGLPVGVIANPYSSTQTYAPGDYVIYKSKLYRCIVAIEEPEEFNSEKWVQVKLANEVQDLAENLDAKADKSTTYTKSEVDEITATKANTSDVEGALASKADKSTTYTKTEVDNALATKMNKVNPTGSGSFSLNRREGSTVGTNSVAMGTNTVASGNNSLSMGYGSAANGNYSVAMGNGAAATGTSSNASGYSTTASGSTSHAEGYETTASGSYSHAEGQKSVSSGDYGSHAEGYKTTASGESSHSEGDRTESIGNNSHAEGIFSSATGNYAHAEGYDTTASGVQSHAEGRETIASAYSCHAEGLHTQATQNYSHSEGCSTTASGNSSHAEGYGTTASGHTSHTEGNYTTASGTESHAEGSYTTASSYSSHAEGNYTTASADSSHAEGGSTTASGDYSHSEGLNTVANHKSQHVFGEYNVKDDSENESYERGNYVEIVGNGYWDNDEEEAIYSNARTLDWSGNEVIAGDLTYNGNKSLTSEISRLDGKIDNLPAPMIFKGTLGVGGTIQTLPTASASNEGFTYKVVTDGTYAGQAAKVGDVFTSNSSSWVYIPSGDEDNDTWRAIKVNGVEKLGNGISSGAVDFVNTDNIEVTFDTTGNKVKIATKNIYTQTQVDTALSNKLDKSNPTGTGSLSLNRKSGTDIGSNSVAVGNNTEASGEYSFAEGTNTVASSYNAHAEGNGSIANDTAAHAEGIDTTASYAAHAEGESTVASGDSSHAEGHNTTARGNYSHAEGEYTTASGYTSHAEGKNTTSSEEAAHAEGTSTTASADAAHAEGYNTTASGYYSHAQNFGTVATRRSQNVFGEYNIAESGTAYSRGDYVEIVGNGENDNSRSNARTLDWNGNETLAGNLTFNGNKSLTSEISRLDGRIDNLPVPMVFKGTLGVNGTISSLPSAGASNEGYTYKVITDGTYASQSARAGDVFTSNGSEWVLIPAGDTDTDTWRAVRVNGTEVLGNGISSGSADFVGSNTINVTFDSNGNKIEIETKNIYTKSEIDGMLILDVTNVGV